MSGEQKYPELANYIKGALLADKIRRAKRPSTWTMWACLIAGMWLGFEGHYFWMAVAYIGSFPLSYVLDKRSFKASDMRDLVLKDTKERMPRIIKEALAKNELESVIGAEPVQALERCAALTNQIFRRLVEERLLGGDRPMDFKAFSRRTSGGADVLMRGAMSTLYRPIMMKYQATPQGLAVLAKFESTLRELHEELHHVIPQANAPQIDAEAQTQIDRVQALLELKHHDQE